MNLRSAFKTIMNDEIKPKTRAKAKKRDLKKLYKQYLEEWSAVTEHCAMGAPENMELLLVHAIAIDDAKNRHLRSFAEFSDAFNYRAEGL